MFSATSNMQKTEIDLSKVQKVFSLYFHYYFVTLHWEDKNNMYKTVQQHIFVFPQHFNWNFKISSYKLGNCYFGYKHFEEKNS